MDGKYSMTELHPARPTPIEAALERAMPTILVVGDFRFEDTFAAQAWRQIRQVYDTEFCDAPAAAGTPGAWGGPTRARPGGAQPANLFPVPLSDCGNILQSSVARLLYQYLCNLDVWAIISCGTASNTRDLLAQLSLIPLPVFVTVASTVENGRSSSGELITHASALRLMPNNDLQAQAILAKVAMLVDLGQQVQVQVFCHGEHAYVQDLRLSLSLHALEGPGRPQLSFITDVNALMPAPENGILICVGYCDALRLLLATNMPWRHLILSDGCYEERVRTLLQETQSDTHIYWSRPAYDCSEYASDAYRAANTVWRTLWQAAPGHAAPTPLIPFESQVSAELEHSRPTHYKFRGADNQHGGYLVEAVRSGKQLPIRMYDNA